tara:strand:- start:1326 stop:2198 length:873 start_codon:yes stop_codon:yes gene_type:complete
MEKFYINNNWKDIAKGHTAFCILGGPSVSQVKDLQTLIKNNFTVTVNHNIKFYPNCDLYLTADNSIAREYFENKEFCLYKFKGGKLLKNQSHFEYSNNPIWVKGKRNLLLQNPNLIKVIACNSFPIYNFSFTTGQLPTHHGEEYCREVLNTHLCLEYRDDNGNSWPTLSPTIQESLDKYGTNPLKFIPGGNISGILFQLLWFMNFDKVIVIGYGDDGVSRGYKDNKIFDWSENEIHAIATHNTIWKERLKFLHGAEICQQYGDYKKASYKELNFNSDKKIELINKLLNLD